MTSPLAALPIPDQVRDFVDRAGTAVVTTLEPDGSPFAAVVWCLLDGDEIVVNSAVGRRWPANLERDPRISIVVTVGQDWVGFRGRVRVVHDRAAALADISEMARRMDPANIDERIAFFSGQQRVSFRLAPERIRVEIGG